MLLSFAHICARASLNIVRMSRGLPVFSASHIAYNTYFLIENDEIAHCSGDAILNLFNIIIVFINGVRICSSFTTNSPCIAINSNTDWFGFTVFIVLKLTSNSVIGDLTCPKSYVLNVGYLSDGLILIGLKRSSSARVIARICFIVFAGIATL